MLIHFHDAAVAPLWSSLNLAVDRGEFIAVLGPNGVGKSTLLGTILGTRKLTAGSVDVNCRVGFIPQQRMFPADLPLRARDLVSLSLAHGAFRRRRPPRHRVDELLAEVGATGLRDRRVGQSVPLTDAHFHAAVDDRLEVLTGSPVEFLGRVGEVGQRRPGHRQ